MIKRQIEARQYVWPPIFSEALHSHDEGIFLFADVPYHLVTERTLPLHARHRQREISEGRLIAPNPLVANTGREFWLVYPIARQHVSKNVHRREWLVAEAAIDSAQDYIGRAVRVSE